VTRVTLRSGLRLRLRLAQLLFEGGTTTVAVDPALGLEPSGGTFRISDGRLDARALRGTLGHAGTLTLARDGISLAFIDVGLAVPALTAQVWDFRAPVASLTGVSRTIRGLRVTIRATARLAPVASRELEESFETPFPAGTPLGKVTVRGRLRG
ncbi:MAG: hypothetical protein M3389_09115, partial [Actinomycetota bacterium]|nr:hypothetical protein [Actinomycetota bacterium]